MKKKLLCVLILLLSTIISVYSQNFKFPEELIIDTSYDPLYKIKFLSETELELVYVAREIPKKGKYGVVDYEIIDDTKKVKYCVKHDYGIPYIELEEAIPITALKRTDLPEEARKRIYFISCLYDGGSYPSLFGGIAGDHFFNTPVTKDRLGTIEYKSSSYLIEGSIHYDETNLFFSNWKWPDGSNYDLPWVENVPGYGIGEYVEIKDVTPEPYKKKINYLLILNGYFSVEKPYLYKQNSRVKQIKVTGLNSGKEKILDVLDTPHPQTVDISFLYVQEPFRVTIMDVYKGTKYDDTCINCMEPYPYAVIPYEDSIGE